tara:strand:- start:482 stop:1180 length:699 start_codon:yes stop_codon:yes gene_type:complete
MTNYLFDIDGTLTYARQPMTSDFKDFFTGWVKVQRNRYNKVFLITGSDKEKTIEQIGRPLWDYVDGSFQNCGNQYYEKGKLRWESNWEMSADLHLDILELIEASSWYGTAGINIEERVGMVNISTVGRESNPQQRREYFVWDQMNKEREKIINQLYLNHKDLECATGGEISIDIYPKGADKSQALAHMVGDTVFFGDMCEQGGNDHGIACASDKFYSVKNPDFTRNILETML